MTIPDLEPLSPGRPRVVAVAILYVLGLRRRWLAEAMAILAVAAGVALVHAAMVASTSSTASVRSLNASVVGGSQLQLLARGGARIPAAVVDRIATLPGVRRAAPVLQVPGGVRGRGGAAALTFVGADPRLVKLSGNLLAGLTSSDVARQEMVALPAPIAGRIGIRLGDDADLQLAGRALRHPVVVAGREQIGDLVEQPTAIVPLRYLQRLTRAGGDVTRLLVEAAPGRVAEVRDAAARIAGTTADVGPADQESRVFATATRPMGRATRAFGVLAAFVGLLLAAGALLVTTADRRRMAAQQWSQGVGPAARVMTLLVGAVVVGAVGTLLGLVAGEAVSRSGSYTDVSTLAGAFAVDGRRVVAWQSVALAAVVGLAAAGLGVLAPQRRVLAAALPRRAPRARATGAARPDRRGRRLRTYATGLGLGCLAGAVVMLVAAPQALTAGLLLAASAVLLVLPAAVAGAVAAFAAGNRPLGQPSSAVMLAVRHLRSGRWAAEAAAIAATAAITAFGATALGGGVRSLQAGLDRATAFSAPPATVWVVPWGSGSVLGTTSFDGGATAAALARLPGPARVSPYRSGFLDVGTHRAWVVGQADGVDPVPDDEVIAGDARRVARDGWATLSTDLARVLRVGVGDTFVLPARHPVRLRVAATTTNLGWPSGAIVLSSADHRRAWASDDVSGYRVENVDRDQVARTVAGDRALRVETADQRAARQRADAHVGLSRLRQIALLTLVAGLLALGATATGLLWQRRAHVARLGDDGATAGQIWRGLLVETGFLVGTGAVLGTAIGLLGQLVAAEGLREVTSFPVVVALRPGIAALTTGTVLAAGLVAVAVVAGGLVAASRRKA